MSKYEPLAEHLTRERDDKWAASFAEVEAVLGFPLPASARRYREWWANQRGGGHSQTKGWQDAGWQVWQVDLEKERVTFRRWSPDKGRGEFAMEEDSSEALFARASAYLGLSDREQLIREGLKALIAREAGRRLARLGGTMPDLKIPPRERPVL